MTIEQSELDPQAGMAVPPDDDPGMDDLHGIALDHEADKQAARDAQLPSGWYTTVPPATFYKREKDEGDTKRVFFTGRVPIQSEKDGTTEGHLESFWSHERRNKVDDANTDTGKPDRMHTTYLALKGVYKKANGGIDAVTLRELIDFLQTYPWRVRLVRGSTDNFAVAYDAVKG